MESINRTLERADLYKNIAEQYGTPVFVYDANVMIDQYNRLVKAFSTVPTKFHYACKALTNHNIMKLFQQLGAGLDAVSIQEVELGLLAGFSPSDILFTPNGVSLEEISLAIEKGVKVNIDNLSILEQFGAKYGSNYPVCIRLNPHIMAGGNYKISTGHIDSKFGISIHQLRHLERIVSCYSINVEGLHMHTGSEIVDVDVFLKGAELLLDAAIGFQDLKYIDFGSGFKVAYKPGDLGTPIEELGKRLSDLVMKYGQDNGKDLEMVFEPGKFLVSEAGVFLTEVNVIKQTTATVFAHVNSGLNHFIRPMFYESYHHILNISNPQGKERIYTVVGNICETDTFAWDRPLPEITEGNVLAFLNAGAYLHTMSSNYNSRFRPPEVMLLEDKVYLIRKRENLNDLLATQIPVEFKVSELHKSNELVEAL